MRVLAHDPQHSIVTKHNPTATAYESTMSILVPPGAVGDTPWAPARVKWTPRRRRLASMRAFATRRIRAGIPSCFPTRSTPTTGSPRSTAPGTSSPRRERRPAASPRESVIGTRLFDHVVGLEPREVTSLLLLRARSGHAVSVGFRCDAPGGAFLRLDLAPLPGRAASGAPRLSSARKRGQPSRCSTPRAALGRHARHLQLVPASARGRALARDRGGRRGAGPSPRAPAARDHPHDLPPLRAGAPPSLSVRRLPVQLDDVAVPHGV